MLLHLTFIFSSPRFTISSKSIFDGLYWQKNSVDLLQAPEILTAIS